MKARGLNAPHKRAQEQDGKGVRKVPRIAMDYCYLSVEDEVASINPASVVVDEDTNDKCALTG